MGYVQRKCTPEGRHVNFARDPLRSYFHDPQKNEIHLLYLYFVFATLLFSISSAECYSVICPFSENPRKSGSKFAALKLV